MNLREHDTMYEITSDLDLQDYDQMMDFVADCVMLGFKRTARYIKRMFDCSLDLSVIRGYLDIDYTG